MPLVSVIIPAHNRAGVLTRAIASVQAQTFSDWEVWIVDDGSSDDTASVAEHLRGQDERIHLKVHPANRGAQAARNTGLRLAAGEWIAFLDSDDEWLPDSLCLRLRLAQNEKCAVVHSECYLSRAPGQRELFHTPPLAGPVYHALLARPGPTFPALLASKSALESIGGLDESILAYQEWDTSIRLAARFSFGFCPEPTYIYHLESSGNISKSGWRSAAGYQQVVRKHFGAMLFRSGPRVVLHHYRALIRLWRAAGVSPAWLQPLLPVRSLPFASVNL